MPSAPTSMERRPSHGSATGPVLLLAPLGTEPAVALARATTLAAATGSPLTVMFWTPAPKLGLPPIVAGARAAIQKRSRGESAAWARRQATGLTILHRTGALAALATEVVRELGAHTVVIDADTSPRPGRDAAKVASATGVRVMLARARLGCGVLAASGATEPAHVLASEACELADRMGGPSMAVHDAVRPRTVDSIVALTRRVRPDVLVLGAPHRSHLARTLFAAVEEAVAEQCTASVVLLPITAGTA